jgi:hypothetical protein
MDHKLLSLGIGMQGEKWAKQKELLEAKEQELSKGFRARNQITLPKTPEMEEEAQMVVEQGLAVQSRNVAAELLRLIWAALDRITDGTNLQNVPVLCCGDSAAAIGGYPVGRLLHGVSGGVG